MAGMGHFFCYPIACYPCCFDSDIRFNLMFIIIHSKLATGYCMLYGCESSIPRSTKAPSTSQPPAPLSRAASPKRSSIIKCTFNLGCSLSLYISLSLSLVRSLAFRCLLSMIFPFCTLKWRTIITLKWYFTHTMNVMHWMELNCCPVHSPTNPPPRCSPAAAQFNWKLVLTTIRTHSQWTQLI